MKQGSWGWEGFYAISRFTGATPDSDIIVTGGGFDGTVDFGTGGDDVVTLTATESASPVYDVVFLRFDREAE
ncbi:MAG TPA: hypothetical protein VM285_03320 [Polyangia bacterium]|nr:hypothetical protein [Polyangia bacterium]